jgi:hypothetical protein
MRAHRPCLGPQRYRLKQFMSHRNALSLRRKEIMLISHKGFSLLERDNADRPIGSKIMNLSEIFTPIITQLRQTNCRMRT